MLCRYDSNFKIVYCSVTKAKPDNRVPMQTLRFVYIFIWREELSVCQNANAIPHPSVVYMHFFSKIDWLD